MEQQNINPNYFYVMPGYICDDKNLSDKAKLMYLKISGLSNYRGFCWASNKYLADTMNTSLATVKRILSELLNRNLIEREFIYHENTKEIKARVLKITNSVPRNEPFENDLKKENEKQSKNNSVPKNPNDLVGPRMNIHVCSNLDRGGGVKYEPQNNISNIFNNNITKEEDITNTTSTGGEKTQALTCENEGPKTLNGKVELMNESLSNLRNEVKEKKEVPTKKIADTNLIQGEININDFSPFSEFFIKERNLKVTNKHFNFFVKWYNKRKADRLGNTIKASIYYSILEKDFRQDFETFLQNRKIEEMQLMAMREKDRKQDEKLKALKIPANSMIEFIENLQLKAMQASL